MEAWLNRSLLGRRPTILVIGDIICDVYLRGVVNRISPEAPAPVFENTDRQAILGGAANVAANLQALGCDVRLLGVIGHDAAGQEVRHLLGQQGISDTWLVEDHTRPTTEKIRLIAHSQQVLRLDREQRLPLEPALRSCLFAHAQALLQDVDGLICSDYQKGVCTPDLLGPLFSQARAMRRQIIVDPKVRDVSLYRGATVLTPNVAEVEYASGIHIQDESDIERAAAVLLRQSQAQALLVTRGQDGMSLVHPPHAPVHISAEALEVFDVTGAGDTVIASFSLAVLSGLSFAEAARLANTAAGIVVGKAGTALISQPELHTALRQKAVPEARKILPGEELVHIVRRHQQMGERVVLTNGCFDLLHLGHKRVLQQARTMGERLIVALNNDASVRQLKGEARPLIPQEDRAELLAALTCVDYVTLFRDATPLELIKQLRPDVLVKGGDYTLDTIVGRQEVEAYGGIVATVPFVEGMSTTGIIERILQRYRCEANGASSLPPAKVGRGTHVGVEV